MEDQAQRIKLDDARSLIIEVEDNRSMILQVDPERRTVKLELPGNYDLTTTYLVGSGTSTLALSSGDVEIATPDQRGRVQGTVYEFKRNTKRKGSPRGTKKAAR